MVQLQSLIARQAYYNAAYLPAMARPPHGRPYVRFGEDPQNAGSSQNNSTSQPLSPEETLGQQPDSVAVSASVSCEQPSSVEATPKSPKTQKHPKSATPSKKKGILRRLFEGLRDKIPFVSQVKGFFNFFQTDNAVFAKGLFFKKVIPLAIGLAVLTPIGWPAMIIGLPISYFSGRYGEKVLAEIRKKENIQLSGAWKHIDKIDALLQNPQNIKDPSQLVDNVNLLIDEALDVSRFPFMGWLVSGLKNMNVKYLGGLMASFTQYALWAKVNANVAEAQTPTRAVVAGIKGGANHVFMFTVLRKVADFISKYIPPTVPWYLRYPALGLKFAIDVLPTAKFFYAVHYSTVKPTEVPA